jgi:hypothetical protein
MKHYMLHASAGSSKDAYLFAVQAISSMPTAECIRSSCSLPPHNSRASPLQAVITSTLPERVKTAKPSSAQATQQRRQHRFVPTLSVGHDKPAAAVPPKNPNLYFGYRTHKADRQLAWLKVRPPGSRPLRNATVGNPS